LLSGATGYVGSAVLDALVRGGHQVTALVRDPEKAEQVSRRGVCPVLGDLRSPATYTSQVEICDGAIHAALDHSKNGKDIDRQAIDALLPAVRRRTIGSADMAPRAAPFFVYTSAAWVLGQTTKPVAEDPQPNPTPYVA
jgi:uncharacterized protein YbjT (DUF2867 family)